MQQQQAHRVAKRPSEKLVRHTSLQREKTSSTRRKMSQNHQSGQQDGSAKLQAQQPVKIQQTTRAQSTSQPQAADLVASNLLAAKTRLSSPRLKRKNPNSSRRRGRQHPRPQLLSPKRAVQLQTLDALALRTILTPHQRSNRLVRRHRLRLRGKRIRK